MDFLDSEGSTDSSDTSSSADSTSADSRAQTLLNLSPIKDMATAIDVDDSDSDSDISMSAETEDEEETSPTASTIHVDPTPQVMNQAKGLEPSSQKLEVSKKRRFSAAADLSNGSPKDGIRNETRKRLKLDDAPQSYRTPGGCLPRDKSLLPAEIWHHVFTFCQPRVLGHLLQVNKSFNTYLDPSYSGPSFDPLSTSSVRSLSPDSIWRISRQAFNPRSLPAPLVGRSELDMWKLACGSTCQFCGKTRREPRSPANQRHPGPGENGVAPVWSFGVRACGLCLQKNSTKEIDLLLSSIIPSTLMAALPFIFLTNELHVLSTAALQSGQHPASIQITKHFSNLQIDEIKKEFDDVKAMGSATAEEWLKGLDGRGRDRRIDAARWELWDLGGGTGRLRDAHKQRFTTTLPHPPSKQSKNGSLPAHPGPITQFSSQHPPPLSQTGFVAKPPAHFDSPAQNGFANFPSRTQPPGKFERTKEEVAELKAARRADIERRCLSLDPPITAAILAHMPSFQAAIQIIQPLVDSSWEVLKPRLISQREEAEQREQDRLAQTRVVRERFDERRFPDLPSRSDSKDVAEREWDDFQAPLRARIACYADEIIRDGWNGGDKVSYHTSPLFAAEVLMYVRKRFYAEVAKDEAAFRATGRELDSEPSNGPSSRKLILENMKWVFDTKIKPYTEPYRKELFLCNACEHVSKYYGFEGVIQHYAAKHTKALSLGSIVVHWKSEWPEIPPFNPDPNNMAAKPYFSAAASVSVPYPGTGSSTPQNYGYGGYPASVSTAMPGPNPQVYQESSGPDYGHAQQGDQYPGHQTGSYAPPPQPYQDPSQVYQPLQYSAATQPPGVPGYNDVPQNHSQNGYGTQYQPPQPDIYAPANPGSMYSPVDPGVPGPQAPYDTPAGQHGSFHQQLSTTTNISVQPPQKTAQYMSQLQDMARTARDLWNSIGSIKEVPGSIKVYTIIYHLLKNFRTNFQEQLPLSMLVDGLTSNKDMRPVRNVNGLLCKACILGMAGSRSGPQKKHFSFPQLVNHFHSVHEIGTAQSNYGHVPDWTKDMVELPNLAKLKSVVNSLAMHEKQLALFTEAVSEIIAAPETQAADLHHDRFVSYDQYGRSAEFSQLPVSQDDHEKYYTGGVNQSASPTELIVFDNGEYDPRNPGELPLVEPGSRFTALKPSRHQERRNSRDKRPVNNCQDYPKELNKELPVYQDQPERSFNEPRPSSSFQAIPATDDYGRVILHENQPERAESRLRYHVPPAVESHVRREPRVITYEESRMAPHERDYRAVNTRPYYSNGREQLPAAEYVPNGHQSWPSDNATAQQSRIHDVVAQISQQVQRVREQQPTKEEIVEAGSEDGEVRADGDSKAPTAPTLLSEQASNAAERFLNDFRPGEIAADAARQTGPARFEENSEWDRGRDQGAWVYRAPAEPPRQLREGFEEARHSYSGSRRFADPEEALGGYVVHERGPAPRPPRTHAYEERYMSTAPEHEGRRDRSPELVDRRYKLNNVVYRDERQGSQGTHRTPSRYARYASVRLENDRARSRSPLYVKVGTHPGQFREMSAGPHPAHALRPEPVYRSRTPQQGVEDVAFERPRPEYFRVYADEPRPRELHYADAFEYVRVADPEGDYMIRRPVRRGPEPIYAPYQDDVYARPPMYESRAPAPVSRAEPTFYEEEYDPRHPAPPPPSARRINYP